MVYDNYKEEYLLISISVSSNTTMFIVSIPRNIYYNERYYNRIFDFQFLRKRKKRKIKKLPSTTSFKKRIVFASFGFYFTFEFMNPGMGGPRAAYLAPHARQTVTGS